MGVNVTTMLSELDKIESELRCNANTSEAIRNVTSIIDTTREVLLHAVDKQRQVFVSAREIEHTPSVMEADRQTLWELREPEMRPLMNAVKELEAMDR